MGVSPQERHPGITRRQFLWPTLPVTIGGTLLFIAGCQAPNPENLVTPPKKERKDAPEEGDVIIIGDEPYLLRNGKRYPIPDLETYQRNTKFEEYGRRLLSLPSGSPPENYPLGEVPTEHKIYDPSTRTEKTNKPLGGEMLVFFPGFMTDGGMPYEVIRPVEDTFISLLVGLKPKHWGLDDSTFFTYGKERVVEYEAKDTARSPEENIKYALDFFKDLKEEFPLVQFNLIAHSLGGLFALAVVREHHDAINNLILINSPVKGIEGTMGRRMLVQGARPLLRLQGIEEEKVTDYLFNLWGNKAYQKRLEDFVSFFTSIGRKIIVIVDENDSIVPLASASLEKAAQVRLRGGGKALSLWDPTLYVRYLSASDYVMQEIKEGLEAHGRPLVDRGVIDYTARQLGEDLADAA